MRDEKCDKCGGSGKAIDQHQTAKQLRALRESHNVSAVAVAARMGFTPAFIGDLEHGRRNWTPDKVISYKLAISKEINR